MREVFIKQHLHQHLLVILQFQQLIFSYTADADSSGRAKLIRSSETDFEVRDKSNFALLSANWHMGINMWWKLWMNH